MAENQRILSLSRAEKGSFRRLNQRLLAEGIDPREREERAIDYVKSESRIADLRKVEAKARGSARLAAARAVTNALTEQRLALKALLAGSKEAELPPAPEEITDAARRAEADAAWRRFYWDGERSHVMDKETEIEQLTRRHGEPSWGALIYRDAAEEAEADAAIAYRAPGQRR